MKHLLLTLGLLFIAIYTTAQCTSGDCVDGFGYYKFDDGSTYEGFFKAGQLHGLGFYFAADGSVYQGEFSNGELHGKGTYFWKDGGEYHGEHRNGIKNGDALYYNEEGYAYGYNWNNDASTLINQDANSNNPSNCSGNCVDGFGVKTLNDGSTLYAIFKNKVPVIGEIRSGTTRQIGTLKNNKLDGYGLFVSGEEHFIGYFKDGKKHGKGITTINGTRKTNDWGNGKIIDLSVFEFDNADFCSQIVELAKLSETDRKEEEELPIEDYSDLIYPVYKKQFLNNFKIVYQEGFFYNDVIEIQFPLKNDTTPSLTISQLKDALNSCTNIEFISGDKYKFEKVTIEIDYDLKPIIKLTYPEEIKADTSCLSGDCVNGFGKKQFSSSVYEGDFVNGQSEGKGTEIWDSGSKYVGEYNNGYRHGSGTYTWTDGAKYTGEYKLGKSDGYGKDYNAEGRLFYEGYYVNNKYEGQGTYHYKNGDKYIGEWKEGKKNGYGTTTWSESGNKYAGNYIDGKRTGYGTLTWGSGDKYVGNWVEDFRTGHGKYTWASGSTFVGEFYKNNKVKGKSIWANGNSYDGEWSNEKKNGYGLFTWTNGNSYSGNWVDDNRTGHGTFIWESGIKYVGYWKDGKQNGTGTEYRADGTIYFEGQWKDGKSVK